VRGRQLGPSGEGRAIRERAAVGLREAAQLLGVDPGTFSRWETGQSVPRRAAAQRWARFVGYLEALEKEAAYFEALKRGTV